MPRYIDADKLIEKIFPIGLVDDGKYTINAKVVKHAIDSAPTADVIAWSIVVAKLEAIDRKIENIYNKYVFEDADYADDDAAIEAVMNALTDVSNEFAELKKDIYERR